MMPDHCKSGWSQWALQSSAQRSPNKVGQRVIIKVDTKIVFKLCPATNIEKLGEEEHKGILNQWYNICATSQVISVSTNKANSNMLSNLSKEFIDEAKKSTSKAFFDKFTHNIRPKVDGSLDYSFTCNWSTVEEAF